MRTRATGFGNAEAMYMVAGDALESGNTREAKKLVLEAREEFPTAWVPFKVQELVPFDEDQVRRDMAIGIADGDADAIEIDDDTVMSEDAFRVTHGRHEYLVLRNEASMHAAALENVTQTLTDEPEMFNANFIERFVNQEKLKKYVYDVTMEDDYVDELASRQPDDFWRLAEQLDVDVPEEEFDEDGDAIERDVDEYRDAVKEAYASDRARAPMEFFVDIYGNNEAMKYAIEAVGIDINEAAAAAVNEDSPIHFLNSYDGKYAETLAGFVYWRES